MASYGEDDDAIAAYEDEGDYIMVFTSVPPTLSHGDGAATNSSPSSPNVHAEEEQMPPSPLSSSGAASLACDEHDMVEMAGAAEVDAAPAAQDFGTAAAPPPRAAPRNGLGVRGAADAEADEDDEEVTDEDDEDDYLYQAYYDRADRGRSRHVKHSSGRRGRNKKASTIGRPRGEGHLSHTAGDHAYAYAY